MAVQDVEDLPSFQNGREDRRVFRAAPVGLRQQEHPGTEQGRDVRGQVHVPGGRHPGGVGHVRQGLRVRHTQLRAQRPAVDHTPRDEQTAKVTRPRFVK